MKLFSKQIPSILIIFIIVMSISGCATPYHVKKISDFDQRMTQVKKIGMLETVKYNSNKEKGDGSVLCAAIVNIANEKSKYSLEVISKDKYPLAWDKNMQRIVRETHEELQLLELEKNWKDKDNHFITKKFPANIKLLKSVNPELDALLVVKCEQHYGNPWAAGLYGFGLIGGLVASAMAESDPVIGQHTTGHNDAYISAVLISLDTADVLWYNFVFQSGANVLNKKYAEKMAKYTLMGLIEEEK